MARYGKKAQQKVREAMMFSTSPAVIDRRRPSLQCLSLVNREAVQQARSPGGYEIRLAAAAASVSGIPRAIVAALLIGVAKLDLPSAVGIARIVAAGVIHRIRIGSAVGL